MMHFPVTLADKDRLAINAIPPSAWFTGFEFENARTPAHPHAGRLDANHRRKMSLVSEWIHNYAPHRRVLDLFSANGAFAFQAARAGAASVTAVEMDPDRVRAAQLVYGMVRKTLPCEIDFRVGNVYELAPDSTPSDQWPQYDLVMCLGGLYHIPDPAFVLKQIRRVTRERLILQTAAILPGWWNHARFEVRRDRTAEGLSSIVGGAGRWWVSVPCLHALLQHAGFKVLEDRRPHSLRHLRRFPFIQRFPWCACLCEPLDDAPVRATGEFEAVARRHSHTGRSPPFPSTPLLHTRRRLG